MSIYLFDANVLIDAKNIFYNMDVFPAFWDWLERQNEIGKVYSVEHVYEELQRFPELKHLTNLYHSYENSADELEQKIRGLAWETAAEAGLIVLRGTRELGFDYPRYAMRVKQSIEVSLFLYVYNEIGGKCVGQNNELAKACVVKLAVIYDIHRTQKEKRTETEKQPETENIAVSDKAVANYDAAC